MAQRAYIHLSEPQKAHPTGEFVIVAYNGDRVLLYLASSHVTVVREAMRLKFKFWRVLKILYPATCKCFVIFNVFYGLVLFCEGDFCHVKCL